MLLTPLVYSWRSESHQSTLQASFLRKQLYLEKDLVRLNIWDTVSKVEHFVL